MSTKLTTDAFRNDGMLPERHSRWGGNVSPPLRWAGIPAGTKSLALVVDDPDAPSGLLVHWLLYDLAPNADRIEENQPASQDLPNGARQARNGSGAVGYGGHQPPSGTHRYFFHPYAVDRDPKACPPESAVRIRPGARKPYLGNTTHGTVPTT